MDRSKTQQKKADSGELPTLGTEAPKLEHLVKDRPRRVKTRVAVRPVIKTEAMLIEDAEEDEAEVIDIIYSEIFVMLFA